MQWPHSGACSSARPQIGAHMKTRGNCRKRKRLRCGSPLTGFVVWLRLWQRPSEMLRQRPLREMLFVFALIFKMDWCLFFVSAVPTASRNALSAPINGNAVFSHNTGISCKCLVLWFWLRRRLFERLWNPAIHLECDHQLSDGNCWIRFCARPGEGRRI